MTVILGLELFGLEAVLGLLVGALVVLLLNLAVREVERDLKLYLCWELILISFLFLFFFLFLLALGSRARLLISGVIVITDLIDDDQCE